MRQNDISILINTIENQYGSSNIIHNLPEYYNLLVVPTNVAWYQSNLIRVGGNDVNPVRGHILLAAQTTQIAITCTATWQGFNYNHKGEMQITSFTTNTDPYDIADLNFKARSVVEKNQINKGL